MIREIKIQKLALIASFACVICSIVTPLVILFTSFLVQYFENSIFEIRVLVILISLGIYIIHSGYCWHEKKHAFILFLSGAFLWICHAIVEYFDIFGSILFLLVGFCFVLGSYFANRPYLRRSYSSSD
jgi:hypothetical protein